MIAIVFFIMLILIAVLIFAGFAIRLSGPISIAGVLTIVTGLLLMTEGLTLANPSQISIVGASTDAPVATMAYTVLTSATDWSILALQWLFVLCGFGLIILEVILVYQNAKMNAPESAEQIEFIR